MKYLDFEWILYIIGIMCCGLTFTFADLTTNPDFVKFVGSLYTAVVVLAIVLKFDESGKPKAEEKNESVE